MSVLRYNERCVCLLSYVAQFAYPPKEVQPEALEQQSVHSILRMPPNSMSRFLVHSLEPFTAVAPTPLVNYCMSIMFRFANSERQYLFDLHNSIMHDLGDNIVLSSDASRSLPSGGYGSQPILQSLVDALEFRGPFSRLRQCACDSDADRWLVQPDLPSKIVGLQSKVLKILSKTVRRQVATLDSLCTALSKKACVTLGEDLSQNIRLRCDWYQQLRPILDSAKIFLRVTWLKAIAGAWCTSMRMTDDVKFPCMFGCVGEQDHIRHYFQCAPLWQIAVESLGPEDSIGVGERLSLVAPCLGKLQRLAFVHVVYHCCRNDPICIDSHHNLAHPALVQKRASEFARHARHLVQ